MEETYAGLQRLSETREFAVAQDDPDIRGWDVVSDTRQGGEVADLIVDPDAMKVRYVEVDLDRGAFDLHEQRRVVVPVNSVDLEPSAKQVRISGMALTDIPALPRYSTDDASVGTTSRSPMSGVSSDNTTQLSGAESIPSADATAGHTRRDVGDEQTRLTRAEEELRVATRKAEAGEVRVAKHVETEHVRQPVSVERERVRIERRPVEAAMARDVTIGEDEIRIPVVEEEVIVEKRPVVKEELIVTKERVRESETVEADLRKERFDVTDDSHVLDTATERRKGAGER